MSILNSNNNRKVNGNNNRKAKNILKSNNNRKVNKLQVNFMKTAKIVNIGGSTNNSNCFQESNNKKYAWIV